MQCGENGGLILYCYMTSKIGIDHFARHCVCTWSVTSYPLSVPLKWLVQIHSVAGGVGGGKWRVGGPQGGPGGEGGGGAKGRAISQGYGGGGAGGAREEGGVGGESRGWRGGWGGGSGGFLKVLRFAYIARCPNKKLMPVDHAPAVAVFS